MSNPPEGGPSAAWVKTEHFHPRGHSPVLPYEARSVRKQAYERVSNMRKCTKRCLDSGVTGRVRFRASLKSSMNSLDREIFGQSIPHLLNVEENQVAQFDVGHGAPPLLLPKPAKAGAAGGIEQLLKELRSIHQLLFEMMRSRLHAGKLHPRSHISLDPMPFGN